jgi:hypothetical protein
MASVDIDIDVDDFMEGCSQYEISEVIEWLTCNKKLDNYEQSEFVNKSSSFREQQVIDNLILISKKLIQLDNSHIEIIENLANNL